MSLDSERQIIQKRIEMQHCKVPCITECKGNKKTEYELNLLPKCLHLSLTFTTRCRKYMPSVKFSSHIYVKTSPFVVHLF